jgi:hypothetical protein
MSVVRGSSGLGDGSLVSFAAPADVEAAVCRLGEELDAVAAGLITSLSKPHDPVVAERRVDRAVR